jgi:hypothetical protein
MGPNDERELRIQRRISYVSETTIICGKHTRKTSGGRPLKTFAAWLLVVRAVVARWFD